MIDVDHPENAEETAKLIGGIADSPMRQMLNVDE
jgi:hypothetical protein